MTPKGTTVELKSNIYTILLMRLALVMFLFSICRVGFYLFNASYFSGITPNEFIRIMLGGFRFDLTAVLYTNALYILLMAIPAPFRFNHLYQKIANVLFYVTNSVALAANVSDFIYFRFTGRRTTAEVFEQFQNEKNITLLWLRFIWDYWYAALIFMFLVALLIWLYRKTKITGPQIKKPLYFYSSGIALFPVIIYLFVISVRGGLDNDTRPITLSDAGKYVRDPKNVSLVLNTPFAVLRTIGKTKIKKVQYYSSKEELDKVFTPIKISNDTAQFRKLNVVILVLESFSKEFVGFFNTDKPDYAGYTPFLDSLLQHSKSFRYSIANGRKSIDALPSIIASVPSMGIPYVLTPYSGNTINTLGSLLKPEGYHTSFFHGAPNGSMGFEAFMRMAQIDQYYGMSEYNNEDDFDNYWGIWDEPFLGYTANVQKDFKEPFLSVFFSVSSHHPFQIPDNYKRVFKGGSQPILKCIQYTDHALRQYFNKVSKFPWYKNTLFVVSADHVSSNVIFEEGKTARGLFSIPIFFFTPDHSLTGYEDQIIQQADVMPTVLSYLHYKKPYLAYGHNVLDSTQLSCAWNYKDDVYQYYEGDYLLQFDGKRSLALYNFRTDTFLKENLITRKPDITAALEQRIKAIIQQYNNRMVENNLTIKAGG